MHSKVNHLEEATAPWNPSPIAFKLATNTTQICSGAPLAKQDSSAFGVM